jgi:ribosomal protein L36
MFGILKSFIGKPIFGGGLVKYNAGNEGISIINSVRTLKVKSSIKKRCENCYVRRKKNNKWYIYCTEHPHHKQRQL